MALWFASRERSPPRSSSKVGFCNRKDYHYKFGGGGTSDKIPDPLAELCPPFKIARRLTEAGHTRRDTCPPKESAVQGRSLFEQRQFSKEIGGLLWNPNPH